MAEEDGKAEIPKEILAPAEGPREHLVTTAVKFLQNPKVKTSPLQQKKAFLEKKGLTKEEIEMAVQRSGITVQDTQSTQVFPPQTQNSVVSYSQSPVSSPPAQQVVVYSQWTRVRDILSIIALAGGLSYAAYRFYKQVLRPLLFGKSKEEDRLDRIDRTITELQQNIVATLTKVQESLTMLQDVVTKQDEKIQAISHEVQNKQSDVTLSRAQEAQFNNDIKTELTSIKGLLLNRRQFPPTPVSTPVLPAWQLQSNTSSPASLSKKSLVTPGGDGQEVSEEAVLNKNEKEELNMEEKSVEVQYSATSLSESIASETDITQESAVDTQTAQQDEDEEVD